MVQVKAIKAFSDNYIWCISNEAEQTAWVVDPGQAEPVLNYLSEHNLTLRGILITHHHYDHTDGVAALVKAFRDIPVYGPRHSPFKGITHGVSEADKVTVYDYTFTVLATPGHTLDHICYINDELSFTGDTLFSAGCGRLFEGSAEQMWHSLCKLRALPDECKIYCTHEYTQANLAFAKAVEPNNEYLLNYSDEVDALRAKGEISLPTQLGVEKQINPFLRSNIATITDELPDELKINLDLNEPWQRFAGLRAWKDNF
ncbi:hydroxyacylglutathione hydrolase [Pseudoalteromonas sp. NCCP-2140]|uniref:hydroxyacylglutathione hydrolase n=1 Tax=Pseudoalteromonas sp. NCCP-2140 TaxID=2942288 RepID=UPI00203E6EA6|nr:hydroxyacylglutathione hydrolase [Pseudoalteromonas sp. NCCP-2140]GKW51670.1 hydroxyacylglutathione hydrolase [Pseudoalteromonas sp. NCCP-2140]